MTTVSTKRPSTTDISLQEPASKRAKRDPIACTICTTKTARPILVRMCRHCYKSTDLDLCVSRTGWGPFEGPCVACGGGGKSDVGIEREVCPTCFALDCAPLLFREEVKVLKSGLTFKMPQCKCTKCSKAIRTATSGVAAGSLFCDECVAARPTIIHEDKGICDDCDSNGLPVAGTSKSPVRLCGWCLSAQLS